MAFIEIEYPSSNQRDMVKAWMLTPLGKPRAITQLVHGLGEHSRRYLRLALKLVDAGFAVCADDHVGHGLTGIASGTLGDFGDKGFLVTVEDELSMLKIASGKFAGIPAAMFGHSWGSRIARSFSARHGDLLTALIICGTCAEMPAVERMIPRLDKLVSSGKGSEADAWPLAEMFESVNKRTENLRTPNDWISADPGVVDDYRSDPLNNLSTLPTFQSMLDICLMARDVTGVQWAERVPKSLPILNIGGDDDPMGDYGEGVYRVANWLKETGHAVSTKVYPGRHEIHNERSNRDTVAQDAVDFLNLHIAAND
jgi:alpha-beta hydrolase superfamily lysophospholipase